MYTRGKHSIYSVWQDLELRLPLRVFSVSSVDKGGHYNSSSIISGGKLNQHLCSSPSPHALLYLFMLLSLTDRDAFRIIPQQLQS